MGEPALEHRIVQAAGRDRHLPRARPRDRDRGLLEVRADYAELEEGLRSEMLLHLDQLSERLRAVDAEHEARGPS